MFPSWHTCEFVTGSDYSRSTRQGCSLWFHGSLSSNVCSDKCKDFFKAVSDKPPSIFTYFYYKEFFDQVLDHRWLRTGNLYPCIFFSLFYLRRRLFLSFKVIVLCPESVMIYLKKKLNFTERSSFSQRRSLVNTNNVWVLTKLLGRCQVFFQNWTWWCWPVFIEVDRYQTCSGGFFSRLLLQKLQIPVDVQTSSKSSTLCQVFPKFFHGWSSSGIS